MVGVRGEWWGEWGSIILTMCPSIAPQNQCYTLIEPLAPLLGNQPLSKQLIQPLCHRLEASQCFAIAFPMALT